MKNYLVSLLTCCSLVASAAGESVFYAPPRQGDDPHRFIYRFETWQPTGYYPGLHTLALKPGPGDPYYVALLAKLAANDINLLRVILTWNTAVESTPIDQGAMPFEWLYPYQRSGQCCTWSSSQFSGISKNKFELNAFDPAFFTYWTDLVSMAQAFGIVVQVVFYETNHIGSSNFKPDEYALVDFPYYHSRPYDLFKGTNNRNGVDFSNGTREDWFQNPLTVDRQKDFIAEAVKTLCNFDNVI